MMYGRPTSAVALTAARVVPAAGGPDQTPAWNVYGDGGDDPAGSGSQNSESPPPQPERSRAQPPANPRHSTVTATKRKRSRPSGVVVFRPLSTADAVRDIASPRFRRAQARFRSRVAYRSPTRMWNRDRQQHDASAGQLTIGRSGIWAVITDTLPFTRRRSWTARSLGQVMASWVGVGMRGTAAFPETE